MFFVGQFGHNVRVLSVHPQRQISSQGRARPQILRGGITGYLPEGKSISFHFGEFATFFLLLDAY